jgi:hypothetical protein
MSATEYVIIAVSMGAVILGVPVVAFIWQRNKQAREIVIADESTPLRGKERLGENDNVEEGVDAGTVINRVLANGIILHTTKGPKKVLHCFLQGFLSSFH